MAEKPTTLPLWATDAGTTLEPSAGEKAAGWPQDKKAPARWMNWILNTIYQWTQYLDAPVGTGSGAGFSATGGSTNGTGLAGAGGGTTGIGVTGTGAASGDGVHGTGGATAGTGVTGTGSAAGSYGVHGVGGATNGIGVYGSGPGAGVWGTSSSGYGVIADGSGTYAPLRIGGPSTQPSNGQVGDLYVNGSGVLKICTVAGTPGTWVSVGAQT